MAVGKGIFVALEGIEGVGKSTQIQLLAQHLRDKGLDPLLVREPGGTELAEAARQLVLHGPGDIPPNAELFLYLVARSDLVFRVIRPALKAGRVVIADRFELTTRTYQVAGRGLPHGDVVAAIHLATGGLEPDLYIVLDLTVEQSRARQKTQGKRPDRIERASDEFMARAAQAYRDVKAPNIAHIDANQHPEAVQSAIREVLGARFPQLR